MTNLKILGQVVNVGPVKTINKLKNKKNKEIKK